uniref:Uncharacterized protein n=1 Tax=Solanum lycopersicum TaxID=4081 RepID=A0A3Q7HNN5_SOLLC
MGCYNCVLLLLLSSIIIPILSEDIHQLDLYNTIDQCHLILSANNQPYRSAYHFQPPNNWMNILMGQ